MGRVAAGRLAVWLQRLKNRPPRWAGDALLFSKSSDPGSRRQKRPDFRQHFLNRLPLPHGQRSLRPSFSSSSFSPCTMRTPHFTFVSEGNPFRRLLIVSKEHLIVKVALSHGTPPFAIWSVKVGRICQSTSARNRTCSSTFAGSRARSFTLRGQGKE